MPHGRSRWTRGAAVIVVIVLSVGAGWCFLGWREVKPPEIKPPPPEKKNLFSLHGVIFFDYDGDGARDVIEPAIPNVKVAIGELSSLTNQSGIYEIKGLSKGNHKVRFEAPRNFRYISLSNSTILPIKTTVEVNIANDTRRDFGLAEGFLTLPFNFGASFGLLSYFDLDLRVGYVRNFLGERDMIVESPPGTFAPMPGTFDQHSGVDYDIPIGVPVVAGMPGRVTYAGELDTSNPRWGKPLHVSIQNDQLKFIRTYGHLSEIMVTRGQFVQRGQVIGLSGMSGSSHPHLHTSLYNFTTSTEKPPDTDPYRDTFNSSSVGCWTKDNDPQFPHSDVIGSQRLCREDGVLSDLEKRFLCEPDKYAKQLLDSYLAQLESNSSYATVARELRRIPELSFHIYGLRPVSIDMVEAVEDIVYLALLAENREVKEAFDLITKGGTPDPKDFTYSVPSWNTELQVLYWLACQNEFKKDDTLALAIGMTNGFWIAVGNADVAKAVREETHLLLDFLRETNRLQQEKIIPSLEDYRLDAKICLSWTGGQCPFMARNHALVLFVDREGRFSKAIELKTYHWVTARVTTLKKAREKMIENGWLSNNPSETVANIERYFYFTGRMSNQSTLHWNYTRDMPGERGWLVVEGETVLNSWIGNPNFMFQYYLQTGKGTGGCQDEAEVVGFWAKSWGIATNSVWRISTNPDWPDHCFAIYYDPLSLSWKAYDEQLTTWPERPLSFYFFKLPVSLQILYWLACQNEFKKDDTLVLALSMSNGLWVSIGDDQVREAVKRDVSELLVLFRETNDLQRRKERFALENYPLEAKVALAWTGGLNMHWVGPATQPKMPMRLVYWNKQRLPLVVYQKDTVSIDTLRKMREIAEEKMWWNKEVSRSVGNVEEFFYFAGYKNNWDFVSAQPILDENGLDAWLDTDWQFKRWLDGQKPRGDCGTEATFIDAWMKSMGIASTVHWMYRLGQASGSTSWWSHSYAIYFDPTNRAWRAHTRQIQDLVPRDENYKSFSMRYFIFRPPVNQVRYLEYRVAWSGNVPDYYYAQLAYTFTEVSFGRTQEILYNGVTTVQMKQWLLYS